MLLVKLPLPDLVKFFSRDRFQDRDEPRWTVNICAIRAAGCAPIFALDVASILNAELGVTGFGGFVMGSTPLDISDPNCDSFDASVNERHHRVSLLGRIGRNGQRQRRAERRR
jgi:hypothetical protein